MNLKNEKMKARLILTSILILFVTHIGFSQFTVTGKIIDQFGKAVSDVTISVENKSVKTVSSNTGIFKLRVSDKKAVLVFTKKGFNTEKVKLSGRTYLEVIMYSNVTTGQEYAEAPMFGNVKGISSKKTKAYSYNLRQNSYDDGGKFHNTEEYDHINDNVFKDVKLDPLSTFSIDVDNASYTNVRRFLNSGKLPYKDAVRIEEMINYFNYDYPDANGEHPFSFTTEYSDCPWNPDNKLLHIGIQGKKLEYNDLKPSNLVFLLDVSGSMGSPNKLPLLKKSFLKLLNNLGRQDKVSIVVYAGAAGLVLPPTPAHEKEKIVKAINNLRAGGSTAGGAGIKLAYKTALDAYIKDGNNRVILATDGDFNVGTSSSSELVRLIEEKRKDDIYLTILGFGMGNYKDGRMEQISNAGNGNYFYIDDIKEADKVFGKEMRANMFTIAKDVKIQIEFNPANVKGYRLIGYVNRKLNKEDFNDDKIDAGELGAGHTVTALYEIIPAGSKTKINDIDDLKYQNNDSKEVDKYQKELLTLKFRYKSPKESKSILIKEVVTDKGVNFSNTSDNFRFSASVAGFGMLLRDSKFKGDLSYKKVIDMASGSIGKDENGYRAEMIDLIKKAEKL